MIPITFRYFICSSVQVQLYHIYMFKRKNLQWQQPSEMLFLYFKTVFELYLEFRIYFLNAPKMLVGLPIIKLAYFVLLVQKDGFNYITLYVLS